jgi:hypothetical protein
MTGPERSRFSEVGTSAFPEITAERESSTAPGLAARLRLSKQFASVDLLAAAGSGRRNAHIGTVLPRSSPTYIAICINNAAPMPPRPGATREVGNGQNPLQKA